VVVAVGVTRVAMAALVALVAVLTEQILNTLLPHLRHQTQAVAVAVAVIVGQAATAAPAS